jgi:hypothetical protein
LPAEGAAVLGIRARQANVELAAMAEHRFKVGQLVDFSPARPGVPTPGRQYVIVRVLPAEGGEFLYRVKSKAETFERVAKESELARRAPA